MRRISLVAVNHLEGRGALPRLTAPELEFPICYCWCLVALPVAARRGCRALPAPRDDD